MRPAWRKREFSGSLGRLFDTGQHMIHAFQSLTTSLPAPAFANLANLATDSNSGDPTQGIHQNHILGPHDVSRRQPVRRFPSISIPSLDSRPVASSYSLVEFMTPGMRLQPYFCGSNGCPKTFDTILTI